MRKTLTRVAAASVLSTAASAAMAFEEVNVAYFLEWPTANQVAQIEKWYDKEMGVKVNWKAFETGAAMSAAMANGDIHIAYSQGLVPFTIAVSKGLKIKAVGIAVSYAENDNCVVNKEVGITQANAKELIGKKVAVPLGTVPHYKLLRQLEHLEVDSSKVKLIDMLPPDGAAALARGDVAMACGWGGSLKRMRKYGDVLMSAQQLEAIGIRVFDVISVTTDFANKKPDLVTKFLEVTDKAIAYLKASPDMARPVIAKAAGMRLSAANDMLSRFAFPTKKEQLSRGWLGGGTQAAMKDLADFFVKVGELPKAMPNYDAVVDTSFYKKAR